VSECQATHTHPPTHTEKPRYNTCVYTLTYSHILTHVYEHSMNTTHVKTPLEHMCVCTCDCVGAQCVVGEKEKSIGNTVGKRKKVLDHFAIAGGDRHRP
jgi:hypothetical protein